MPTGEACELYGKFWEQYGRAMKLGVIEVGREHSGSQCSASQRVVRGVGTA